MARILAQTKNYKLISQYHTVWLERPDFEPVIIIDDFLANPKTAIIDYNERWCAIVGFGVIIYYLQAPFSPYEYNQQTGQWVEFFRNPRNIWIIDDVYQTGDNAIRLEVGPNRENQGSYEFSMKNFTIQKITSSGKKSEEINPKGEFANIVFSKDGATLLHSFNEGVDVWSLRDNQLRYHVSGELLGVSSEYNTFQTTAGTWDIDTGDGIDSPTTFHNWHRRLKVFEKVTDENYCLEVIDEAGVREPQLIQVGGKTGISKVWHTIDPNGRYIAAFFYINIWGHDLDQTICYDLETGQKVYSFIDDYDVSFSGIHNLLLAKNKVKSSLTVYDLVTQQKLELEKVSRAMDEHTIRINPKNIEFVAAINKKRNMIFLGKINQMSQRKTIRRTRQKILDIDFSPAGTHLAGSLSDGEVHIWDVNSHQLIQRLTAS